MRWALVGLIVVVAAVIALWPRGGGEDAASDSRSAPAQQVPAQLRADAALAPCPLPAPGATGAGPLAGITLTCLADGAPVDLAAALAGKPALLNLWAYWCGPCAEELPYLRQYAERAGTAVTVLTVHSDPEEAKALLRLTGLDVHLPGVLDGAAKVRAAAGAPAVLPISLLVRPDGSLAQVVVRTFTGVDDIADTVATALGVRA
ncbi:Thiol-disulfide isomerase or thioredoxin [Nocardia amikacinitolerans]|uniref:Thiol-disulfide isomerase or thioredoxin n=1 Tax=Nocardia amikacinitolerans TaxID=756689 RepID=A0A285M006_9NOCA|nr:TlpA disulfide reductase family protein [Nocardia amikacinitolerans]MCP2294537.1 Thiol-disulfide isomerase or thioredoxin [Nocardia amikacinitolerans]SNY88871.1 Thiol-disulfide isomerase or thioredoxin [Nocardia amikacinitolerans]